MSQKGKTPNRLPEDPESLEQIWYSSLAIQEQLLAEPENHQTLLQLWENSTTVPDWLGQNDIKGVKFISRLPRQPRLSNVFHAIGESQEHLLVKLGKLDSENSGEPDAYARKITNAFQTEIVALKRLANAKLTADQRNQLPQLISDGILVDDQQRDVPYIVLKYIPGLKSIEESAGQFKTAEKILRFMQRVCELVQAVHRAGVVHGDLHLNNLFLSNDDEPVLLDFNASQFFRGSPLDRGFNQRDFGTQSNYDIQETKYPNRALSPAIDVLNLFEQLEWLINSLRLRQHDQNMPPESSRSAIDLDSDEWMSAFVRLRAICTAKVPDYRPADAGHLHGLLGDMLAGRTPEYKISYRRKLSAAIRTYPVESLVAVCLLALGLGLAIMTASLASYTASLREKDRASQWLSENQLKAISLFSQDSIATEKRQEKRSGLANRQNVANLLLAVPEGIQLQNKFLIPRLNFTLELVKSRMEVDRFADNLQIVRRALKLSRRINGSDSTGGLNSFDRQAELADRQQFQCQCLEIQLLGILSRIEFELAVDDQQKNSAALLREAAARYDAISPAAMAELKLSDLHLETGRVLIVDSHRPQHLAAWSKKELGKTAWSIVEAALRSEGARLNSRGKLTLAEIYTVIGLNFHQGAYADSIWEKAENKDPFFYFDKANALLKSVLETQPIAPQLSAECEIALAELNACKGMRMTYQHRFQEAQAELSKAFDLVKKLAAADPGSITLRRMQISIGWDLADAYSREASMATNPAVRIRLQNESLQVRRLVIKNIKVDWRDEQTEQTRSRYLVNAVRLAASLFATNQDSEAIEVFKDMEDSVGLKTLNAKHGLGFDLAACLLKLLEAYPNDPKYSLFLTQHSKRMVELIDAHRKRVKSDAGPSTGTDWREHFEQIVQPELRKLDLQGLSLASIPELETYLRSIGIVQTASTPEHPTP